MKFSIEAVTKMTGISAASLRNWEKRYGFPCPERSEGGHRFYTAKDVDFLRKALVWIEEGQNLNQIADSYKTQVKAKCGHKEIETPLAVAPEIPEAADDVNYRTEMLYQALIGFDQLATLQHYSILNAKLTPDQFFDRVFGFLLRRLKGDWCKGKVSVAQEHYLSAFIRIKLSAFLAIDFPPFHTKKVVVTALGEERYEAGLMLLAAHLKFRGYHVYYMGGDLPAENLETIASHIRPDVICISYLFGGKLSEDYEVLKRLKTPICLSGPAIFDTQKAATLVNELPEHIHLCTKAMGSEVAQFVEMICQCKTEKK